MTNMNGAGNHNVEELLASIRTSIAEEMGPSRLVPAEIHVPARREAQYAEDTPEFELPAIFKPGHNAAPEKPKLFGRLSDALKTNAPEQGRVRTVIPFDPSVAGRLIEPAQPRQQFNGTAHQASGNVGRSQPPQASPQSSGPQQDVKRVMPTFFDTRLNRMGEMTRAAYAPKEEPAPQPEPQPAPHRQPPMLPGSAHDHHAENAVDDAAAQLLRPMLRQWLQENMPKIVEKALLSEVQADLDKKRK